ncbi:uncharacterized protein [Triticum aestivum]|uniref:uncharacterized protein isoform X4 n=1 Tax=Triticum aestivum TaxID=4565 RepID=UPI001D0208B4|nr:uncharacterized protein LOC123088523 isoform X4 [Triticum aestivum]
MALRTFASRTRSAALHLAAPAPRFSPPAKGFSTSAAPRAVFSKTAGVVAASLLHLLGRGMPIDVPGNLPVGYWLLAKLHHLTTQAGVPEAALPTLLFSRRLCTQAQPPVRQAASLALLVFSRHGTTQPVLW